MPPGAPTRPGGASWTGPRPGWPNGSNGRGPVGPPRGFPGLTGYLRDAAGPGWALVGDADYFKDLITAHGITDALRDAEILARVVASSGPDAVSRYQAERDELSLRLFRVTGRIASFDWTAEEIGGHLLEQLSHDGLPGIRRRRCPRPHQRAGPVPAAGPRLRRRRACRPPRPRTRGAT